MTKKVIEGFFGLNEQDPYEPVGIFFVIDSNLNPVPLENILEQDFQIARNCCHIPTAKKLRITIEEI